jgi:hypothetical protein
MVRNEITGWIDATFVQVDAWDNEEREVVQW